MNPLFHPKLINGNCGDPTVYVDFIHQKRAILFDCGDLHTLPARQLLKTSHIFISHTHMDHFIGFDHLLRLFLGREKTLHIFGPAGFIEHLHCKLCGYVWNLVQNYTSHFEIRAYEVTEGGLKQAQFICRERFKLRQLETLPCQWVLVDEPAFSVLAAPLTHSLPSLGFAFQERFHINVNKSALDEMGLTPGPWINQLKDWIWEGRADDEMFTIPAEPPRQMPLWRLKGKLVTISRGERIAYVADTAWNPQNAENILNLASGADYFFCEAAFLHADREQAQKTAHLTAAQAGCLARQAGAQRLIPFHFSPRYHDNPQPVEQEAQQAFIKSEYADLKPGEL